MSKLWDKGVDLDKAVEAFTVGKDTALDNVLIPYDCKASIAHARMLGEMGYLENNEVEELVMELEDAFSDNINWEYNRQKLIHLMGIFRLRRLIKNFVICVE